MSDVEEGAVTRWFTPVAIAALLFELLGLAMFLSQLSVDPALLERDQRALWEAAPPWMVWANGVAVATGVAGAVLLLMKRAAAAPLLLASLAAVIVQFSALVVVPGLRSLIGSDALLVPFVVIVACYAIWHFAWLARRRGVLR